MDIEDLIKRGHRHNHDHYGRKYGHHDNDTYHSDHQYHKAHHRQRHKIQLVLRFLRSSPHKKAFLAGAILLGLVVVAIIVLFLMAIIPVIQKGLMMIDTNGVKGILDALLPYLDKIWKGNG